MKAITGRGERSQDVYKRQAQAAVKKVKDATQKQSLDARIQYIANYYGLTYESDTAATQQKMCIRDRILSAFTALLNCAEVGRRNRILTNYRFLSHSLFYPASFSFMVY